jgi:outer membrane protein TolC
MARIILITICALLLLMGSAHAETLTLQDCLRRAASANPDLKVTSFDEKVAAEGVGIARSGYLPRLDFLAGTRSSRTRRPFSSRG